MRSLVIALVLSLSTLAAPAAAQDREVPYWATIRASELNMRVGPSANYKIDWVYKRQGLPVKVVMVIDGWRRIEDPDGEGVLVFETDASGRVTEWRAGLPPQVDYVEGCS